MNVLGWVLAGVGVILVIAGVLRMLKMKKMQTVPFRKPSEIMQQGPQAGDAKGMVSTEGQVSPGPQPLIAPMSGQPCLAYEILVERKWEKQVMTEKGAQKKTGTDRAHSETKGAIFQVTDGAGAVLVDASKDIDADMEKAHSNSISVGTMIPGTLTFGRLQMNTPTIQSSDTRTTAFVGTEKILKVSPTLYALGHFSQGPQGWAIAAPKGIGTGKLILSAKGREALLGKTKMHMIICFVIGGLFLPGGTALGIFGPKGKSTSCEEAFKGEVKCDGRMYSSSGKSFQWTVEKAGAYEVRVSQPPNLKFPIYPTITIQDASKKTLGTDVSHGKGQDAILAGNLPAGTFTLTIADRDEGLVEKLEGGFGFNVEIKHLSKEAPPMPTGSAAADKDDKDDDKDGKPTAANAKTGAATAKLSGGKPTGPGPTAAASAAAPGGSASAKPAAAASGASSAAAKPSAAPSASAAPAAKPSAAAPAAKPSASAAPAAKK